MTLFLRGGGGGGGGAWILMRAIQKTSITLTALGSWYVGFWSLERDKDMDINGHWIVRPMQGVRRMTFRFTPNPKHYSSVCCSRVSKRRTAAAGSVLPGSLPKSRHRPKPSTLNRV